MNCEMTNSHILLPALFDGLFAAMVATFHGVGEPRKKGGNGQNASPTDQKEPKEGKKSDFSDASR
jgi:hypothetical protein